MSCASHDVPFPLSLCEVWYLTGVAFTCVRIIRFDKAEDRNGGWGAMEEEEDPFIFL